MNIDTIQYDGLPGVAYPGKKGMVGDHGPKSTFIHGTPLVEFGYRNNDTSWYVLINFGSSDIDTFADIGGQDDYLVNDFVMYYKNDNENVYLNQITHITHIKDNFDIIYPDMIKYMPNVSEDKILVIFNQIKEKLRTYPNLNRIIFAEYKDSWSNKSKNDISIIINTRNIEHEQYTGNIKAENDTYYAETETSSSEVITFDVLSNDPNDPIGDVMIEAEFIKQNPICHMSSMLPDMYDNNPQNRNASEYPLGFPENMSYDVNYDNEELENFSVIVKNFNDGTNESVFHSNVFIPKNDYSDYIILVYIYTKISDVAFKKEFLGEMTL